MIRISDDLTILGDVHLGKKFRTGVPLHRSGDREKMVEADFVKSLMECTSGIHVQMGDLFDAFSVPEAVILFAARAYIEAASENPTTMYVILRGNHDASRDTTKASSFDVLAELLGDIPNIVVAKDDVVAFSKYAFIPWHPFKSSTEMAMKLLEVSKRNFEAVFGHWDVESFGGTDYNLVPTNVLKSVTKRIYTGHIHLPTVLEKDGIQIIVTGSMQAYSHSEDATGQLYVTIPYDDLLLKDHTELLNKNVRVLVKDGEVPPEIDCLSLITKKVTEEENDEEVDLDVSFDTFDMNALFHGSLQTAGVGPTVAEKITAKYQELKNA